MELGCAVSIQISKIQCEKKNVEYPINDWYILMAYVESKYGYESVDAYITGTLNAYQTLPLQCPVNIIAVNSLLTAADILHFKIII